jgi:hypothetical protein
MALTTFVLILYLSIIALIPFQYIESQNYHDFFNARKQGNTLTITEA